MNETVDTANPDPLARSQVLPGSRPAECGSRMGPRWYVVQTHPGAERRAIIELANQDFAAVTPMRRIDPLPPIPGAARSHRKPGQPTLRPYCPGYVFVLFDQDVQPWRAIHNTRGVKRLFSYDPERPIPVKVGVIERLMVEMSRSIAGVIPTAADTDPLPPGIIVRVLTPGMRGEMALVMPERKPGLQRVQMLRNGFLAWLPRHELQVPE